MKDYTLARPYAKAAYLFAVEAGKVAAWSAFLGTMAEFLNDAAIKPLLKHPGFKVQDLLTLAVETFGFEDALHIQNFLLQLLQNHRLSLLPEIHELFLEDVKKASSRREVVVKSAFKLSRAELKSLETDLQQRFNQAVEIERVEDPSLIGGMIIESGDYVLDSSLKGQLQRLKQNLML